MISKSLDREAVSQIESLNINHSQPLLISDADEVILNFVKTFEIYLKKIGLYYDLTSYALFGNIKKIKDWLPSTCAYRLMSEKKDLPEWHHLNTKSYNSVHLTNNSVQKLAISELLVDEEDLENFVIDL